MNVSFRVRGFYTRGFCTRAGAALFVLTLCMGTKAWAADQTPRAVRLLSFEGSTQILGAGEDPDQSRGSINTPTNTPGKNVQQNMPLFEGMQVRTGENGRAEIEFEDGSVARETPNSRVSLEMLAERSTEVRVVNGLAYFELRGDSPHPYAVRYGSSIVQPVTDSTFRVTFDAPPGEVSVFAGEVVVAGGAQKVIVRAGETLRFDENDGERYVLSSSIEPDSWDEWNEDREASAAAANEQQSEVRSVQPDGTNYGWPDLDTWGDWYSVPNVGAIWQPADAGADFDPYAVGT